MRRGPSTGYDFAQKRQYRRDIYASVRAAFHGHLSDRRCAILPSSEGDEIESALRAGFKQRHICIIDENPAIVATLRRRYPSVTAIGVTASRAAKRVLDEFGRVDFVNLDLCGPIGKPLWDTLEAWRQHSVVTEGGLMAVTVLRGRERHEFGAPVKVTTRRLTGAASTCNLADRDMLRLARITAVIGGLPPDAIGKRITALKYLSREVSLTPFSVRHGTYRSTAGHQTMLWALWKLHSKACLCDECVAAFQQQFAWDRSLVDAFVFKHDLLLHLGWTAEECSKAVDEATARFGQTSRPELFRDDIRMVESRVVQ